MGCNPTVVFVKPGEVALEQRDKPDPQGDELLIRTRCTQISIGTELTLLKGEFPAESIWGNLARYPLEPGYSNIGRVEKVGANVSGDWIGKRVATYSGHARYVTAKPRNARIVEHEAVSDEHAAFFTIAEIVMNAVRRSHLCWGESAVVYGAGPLGQLIVRFCRIAGVRPVVAVDMADSRLACLPRDAAVVPVNSRKDDVATVVKELTRGRLADVVFEVTGSAALIPEEFGALRDEGRFVIVSSPSGPTEFDFHDLCNWASYTIIGAHNRSHPPVATPGNPWTQFRHAELFFDLLGSGELDLDPLITHRPSYTEVCELYRMLLEDRSPAMGVLIDWTD
jgi:2-desacetyl-2-hydroxyethyl bacteriochlorophyllide A dehydrogenase